MLTQEDITIIDGLISSIGRIRKALKNSKIYGEFLNDDQAYYYKNIPPFRGFYIKPVGDDGRTFIRKAGRNRGWIFFILFYGLLLSFVSLAYFFTGMISPLKPFLAAGAGKAYLVQALISIPVSFSGVLAYCGLSSILLPVMGGKGTFEKAFNVQVYALVTPALVFTILPKLLFIDMPWFAAVSVYFIIPELWNMFLSVNVISKAYKLDMPQSCYTLFFISSVPLVLLNFVFIR